jgi:hypothetical protein
MLHKEVVFWNLWVKDHQEKSHWKLICDPLKRKSKETPSKPRTESSSKVMPRTTEKATSSRIKEVTYDKRQIFHTTKGKILYKQG